MNLINPYPYTNINMHDAYSFMIWYGFKKKKKNLDESPLLHVLWAQNALIMLSGGTTGSSSLSDKLALALNFLFVFYFIDLKQA